MSYILMSALFGIAPHVKAIGDNCEEQFEAAMLAVKICFLKEGMTEETIDRLLCTNKMRRDVVFRTAATFRYIYKVSKEYQLTIVYKWCDDPKKILFKRAELIWTP